jgi:lipoprotein-anchoring transpeptidase ErfK/SrfK
VAGGRRHRRLFIVLAAVVAVALLGVAGMAYAGYDYSKKYEGRILPGATVAGVDIGGMAPQEALKAVKRAVRPQLTRTIEVTWEDRSWEVTPKELGAESNARAAVDAALAASSETSFLEKTRMRVLGDELTFAGDVAISYPRAGARGFIEGLASNLYREPRDAALDYSSGWVEITASRRGREVNTARSVGSLRDALLTGASEAKLSVNISEPQVTEEAYDQVILLRIGENKLYPYQDGKITHEYLVATGQPAYPTPTGVYEITEKRYMPTWVNPAPDGWGQDMPASIPPGISNPLGLRALNWSAPGIRFHGTTATYSLGFNASHGCVRMSNEDVIELYDLVEVGTPIVSLESATYNPLIEESSSSEPTAENSAN